MIIMFYHMEIETELQTTLSTTLGRNIFLKYPIRKSKGMIQNRDLQLVLYRNQSLFEKLGRTKTMKIPFFQLSLPYPPSK